MRTQAAGDALGAFGHALGNAIQVVELASLALVRAAPSPSEPLADLRGAAERAGEVLAAMTAAMTRLPRKALGPPVAPAVRSAVECARPAMAAIELRVELVDDVASRLLTDELEAVVFACMLDAADAPHLELVLRERTIERDRWIRARAEWIMLAASSSSSRRRRGSVSSIGSHARSAASSPLSAGRTGRELVLAWPVAT